MVNIDELLWGFKQRLKGPQPSSALPVTWDSLRSTGTWGLPFSECTLQFLCTAVQEGKYPDGEVPSNSGPSNILLT